MWNVINNEKKTLPKLSKVKTYIEFLILKFSENKKEIINFQFHLFVLSFQQKKYIP